jgi:hypothetical protein
MSSEDRDRRFDFREPSTSPVRSSRWPARRSSTDGSSAAARGDTFADYRRLRTLREYVLVSQRERRIDVFRRDGRRWVLDEHARGEAAPLEAQR